MSLTRDLTRGYGRFFFKCAEVAICPYLLMANVFVDSHSKLEELVLGVAACVFFSTAVPILPTVTSLTFAIAAFAACLALATMFVTYPVAMVSDAINSDYTDSRFAY